VGLVVGEFAALIVGAEVLEAVEELLRIDLKT
jgi:hypothetical protein